MTFNVAYARRPYGSVELSNGLHLVMWAFEADGQLLTDPEGIELPM
jgi:hypothetical protein